MKILFIENRYKTKFWEAIASSLADQGHQIHWIVQNHEFKPQIGNVNVLEYPKLKKKIVNNLNYQKIIETNRGLNFFELQSPDFIYNYHYQIEEIINKIEPNLVFGECTLVHELICIEICKSKDILFLHPSSCRYPKDRFSFYKYDTLEALESGESYSEKEITNLVAQIASRKVQPSYLANRYEVRLSEKIYDKCKILLSYIKGERFNTPSPLVKRNLIKRANRIRKQWDNSSIEGIDKGDKFCLLYSMQMQPEANIDIWGYPYHNQLELIKILSKNLKEYEKLYIKPNPKSKYELNEELIDYIGRNENVISLNHSVSMNDIFDKVDCFVGVTGTVALEALISKKKVLIFGFQEFQSAIDEIYYTSKDTFRLDLDYIKHTDVTHLPDNSRTLLEFLIAHSFSGNIGDGLHNRHFLENDENLKSVLKAFENLINSMHLND